MNKVSEHIKVAGASDVVQGFSPIDVNGGATTSLYISMKYYHLALIICEMGVGDDALAWQVWQAVDTAGSGTPKVVTGKTAAHTALEDGKTKVIDISTEDLDVEGGFDCIAIACTASAGAATLASAVIALCGPRFAQASLPV